MDHNVISLKSKLHEVRVEQVQKISLTREILYKIKLGKSVICNFYFISVDISYSILSFLKGLFSSQIYLDSQGGE